AEVAGGDIPAYMARHLRPPVIPGHQLQRFEPAGVTGDPGVVVLLENAPAEIFVSGDDDLTPEVQEPSFGVPFGAPRGSGAPDLEQFLRGKRDGRPWAPVCRRRRPR